jgi:copper chaperone CopZ
MRPTFIISIIFAAILISCKEGSGSADTGNKPSAEIVYVKKTGSSRTTATLFIGGMTCEAGCGGKITKELTALNGVFSTDIEFAENRDLNMAIVEFDPSLTNPEKLVAGVNEIADGKLYSVSKVEVTTYTPSAEEDTEEGHENGASITLGDIFRFPNLAKILKDFIVG